MDFRYEPHERHLLVVATGRFDADACRAALGEILALCRDRGLANVLIDARAIAELVSIADRFDLAKAVAASRPPRVAILVSRENAERTRVFEDTAVNRGAQVRTTASEDEARRYLGIA